MEFVSHNFVELKNAKRNLGLFGVIRMHCTVAVFPLIKYHNFSKYESIFKFVHQQIFRKICN